jgi:hypothetical protein
MSSSPILRRFALLAVAGFGLSACDQQPASPSMAHSDAHAAHAAAASPVQADGRLLQSVKATTSRFNSTVQAIRAGYQPDTHCVAHPELGAMGFHWVNGALIDPVFDPMNPEVLLYAPGPGNQPRLIGVEYVVIDVGQDRPHFDGHPFDIGGVPPLEQQGIPHWSLHVWAHEYNPAGTFTPFNPNVSCG